MLYLRKSTTLESGRKWTPVLGSRDPYLFLSSSEASLGEFSSSLSGLPRTILFSSCFIILKNSSKFSLPSYCRKSPPINSMASCGSLPRLLIMVCKSDDIYITTLVLIEHIENAPEVVHFCFRIHRKYACFSLLVSL